MGDRQREEMATTSTAVATVPPQTQEEVERMAVITLRPTVTETRKKVVWTNDTVDNEHMNKKKSKCCCIYEKPHKFGESDSEDSDDEVEHCHGHVEKRKHKTLHHHHHEEGSTTTTIQEESPEATHEPTAQLTLQPGKPAPAPPDKKAKPAA